MPTDVEANWVTGSHDMGRVASRLGEHVVDHMNMLALMLPGLSVTYQAHFFNCLIQSNDLEG